MSTPKDFSPAAGLPVEDFAAPLNESLVSPALKQTDPNDPPWGLSAAAVVLAASFFFLIVIPLLAVAPYVIYNYRGADYAVIANLLQTDKALIFISIAAVLPAHLLTLGIIWVVVTGFGKRSFWPTLGWSWSENFNFWTSAGLAVALLLFALLMTNLIGSGKETQIDQIVASSMGARIATAFLAAVTAPLVEEIIYRGILYPALQRAIGMLWAVVGVSTLFTLVHVFQYSNNLGVITAVALLSFTLTIVRARSGRLLPCFVMHLIFNGIQSAYILFQPLLQHTSEQKAAAFIFSTQTLHALL